jgi:hypothetical protein
MEAIIQGKRGGRTRAGVQQFLRHPRQLICSVTVVLWFAVADVPLKVKVCVPVPAFWVTVIVAVAVAGSVPSRETEDGEIAQDVPPGRPL